MRPFLCALAMLIRYRFGASAAIALHTLIAKPLASGQLRPSASIGVTTCRPLPPVVLQKLTRPRSWRRSRISRAPAMTSSNRTSGAKSFKRLTVPGAQLQPSDLGCGDECFNTVELEIRLPVTPHRDRGDQVRLALAGVALEEPLFAGDPIGEPDDRAGAPPDVCNQPVPDRLIKAGKIEFAYGPPLVRV